MLRGGADIKVIQELMGHASTNTTGVYLHLDIGDLKKVYDNNHPLALQSSENTGNNLNSEKDEIK